MRQIYQHKTEIIILLLLLLVYFLLRLPNLTLQPIFADEAIYIRWAQIMRSEATLRFISLQDGKTPLFMWLMIPFLKFFSDPLWAGRFLSVLAGLLTFSGAVFLGWRYLNFSVALWAGLLITLTPYIVFFDRMALVDTMLSGFVIWSLVLALLVVEYKRLDIAMILGYFLGGGMLVKTPGVFSILVLPLTLISFNWKQKNRSRELIKVLVLFAISILIGLAIYNVLRLGPGFDNLSSRNQDYVHSPTRLLQYPVDPLIPHIKDLADWIPSLITFPIFVFILGGIIISFFKKNKVALAILFWFLPPLVIEMLLLQTFTSRYILFSIPPMLILAAYFIDQAILSLKKYFKYQQIFLTIIFILLLLPQSLDFNIKMLIDPLSAPLPREARRGYLEDWTAGYNLEEIAQFIKDQAKTQAVVVGTEGYFGTLPDGLWIYLDKTPNVTIIGGQAEVPDQVRQSAKDHLTFYVANKSRVPLTPPNLVLLKEYPKAVGPDLPPDAMLLFKVNPEK